jgi:hypothetical protein
MNQLSAIGFGTDANVFAGYAQSAGDKLGNIDFVFENIGPNVAYIRLMQYDGVTSPSGYATLDTAYTTAVGQISAGFKGFALVPGGTATRSYVLLNKRVAFFGSGNTSINISTVIRNKSDLRNAQIDIVASGRRGWGYDEAYNKLELKKKWGTVPGPTTTSSNINAGTGNPINPTPEGV